LPQIYEFIFIINVPNSINLNADKINSKGNGSIFIDGDSWSTWFSNGSRLLTSTKIEIISDAFHLSPNPAQDILIISWPHLHSGHLEIINAQGNTIIQSDIHNRESIEVRVSDWAKGLYFVNCTINGEKHVKKFIKID